MIVNSKIKQKSKTVLGVIRNLVLDFILYFVTTHILRESTSPFPCDNDRSKFKNVYNKSKANENCASYKNQRNFCVNLFPKTKTD